MHFRSSDDDASDHRPMQELNQRSMALPLMKTNLGQIDGTIKAPFSHFAKSSLTPAQNLEQFGLEFYQVNSYSVVVLDLPFPLVFPFPPVFLVPC